jgi:hypothetical protein
MSEHAARQREQAFGDERTADMMAYERGRYAEGARFVDLCMAMSDKPCRGGECDLDAPCDRHRNLVAVVLRYLNWGRSGN